MASIRDIKSEMSGIVGHASSVHEVIRNILTWRPCIASNATSVQHRGIGDIFKKNKLLIS